MPEVVEADYKYKTEIIAGIVCAGVAITTFITVMIYLKMYVFISAGNNIMSLTCRRDKRKNARQSKPTSQPQELVVFGGRETVNVLHKDRAPEDSVGFSEFCTHQN